MNGRRKLIVLAGTVLLTGYASTGYAQTSVKVTFTKDVAPIFHANCVSCHQPGQIGPMSLRTYDEVRPWAISIRTNVADGVMPPWHADPGFGPWENDRSLSKDEKATILAWIDSGVARGNPDDMPPIPEAPSEGWQLGEPDHILTFDEYAVPGGGPDLFHNFEVQTDFDEDKWITAIEIMAGNRKVMHHVILWQGQPGQSPDGWLGAWASGAGPNVFPEGTGRLLKKGAPIVGDMHYHPVDTDEIDQTRVGLHFAKNNTVEKELVNLWVINLDFEIPAGDPNYEARSSHTFAQDSHILSLAPHMHYRGKDFSYTATYPDGSSKVLLEVSKYDFNWQTGYEFIDPIAMPKGSRLDCVAHWDNSPDNPANPDPTRNVRFGNESFDEMMIGFVDFIVDEGVRPNRDINPVDAKIVELVDQHPGDVFAFEVPQGPGGKIQLNALHIPREGEGGWWIPFGTMAVSARVHEIKWTGDRFECLMSIPGQQGANTLKGSVDRIAGTIVVEIIGPNGNGDSIEGKLATNEAIF